MWKFIHVLKGGKKYRQIVKDKGGKTVSILLMKIQGLNFMSHKEIIHYLFKHYGKTGQTPRKFSHYPKLPYISALASVANVGRGIWIDQQIIDRPAPEKLLELWSF